MTEALRRPEPLPDDTGDVLASIRRLIARDHVTARAPGVSGAVAPMSCAAGRDILLPCAAGGDRTRPAMTRPQFTSSLNALKSCSGTPRIWARLSTIVFSTICGM